MFIMMQEPWRCRSRWAGAAPQTDKAVHAVRHPQPASVGGCVGCIAPDMGQRVIAPLQQPRVPRPGVRQATARLSPAVHLLVLLHLPQAASSTCSWSTVRSCTLPPAEQDG